jgi:hypothetical protein
MQMKTLVRLMGIAAVAATMAIAPAVPAQAQSITFSLGRPHFPFILWPHVSVRPHGHVAVRFGSDFPRWMRTGHHERCADRYRSYDPWSDTYLGFDGDRHFCRL